MRKILEKVGFFPRIAVWELTLACNMRCGHCGSRAGRARPDELDTEEALELVRHDAAHVMAQAVQELYPGTQVTIGPAIENGFYYDFVREQPFTPEDLEQIEERMRQIVAQERLATGENHHGHIFKSDAYGVSNVSRVIICHDIRLYGVIMPLSNEIF